MSRRLLLAAVAPGFEPGRGLPPYTLSRRAPSSARASHRDDCTERPDASIRGGPPSRGGLGRRPVALSGSSRHLRGLRRAAVLTRAPPFAGRHLGGGGVIRTREGRSSP